MGWQDDPIAEENTGDQSQPWMNDPVESAGEQTAAPEPSMGAVAMNAVPKGMASAFQSAYDMAAQSVMGQIVKHGMAALTGNKAVAERPDMQARAVDAGIVDPSKNPQTGPQKIVDAMIQGAVAASVVPGPGVAGTAKAAVTGAVSAGVGKTVENFARDIVGDTAAHWLGVATGAIIPAAPLAAPTFRIAKPAPQSELNTKTRMQTIRDGQALGLVVPPTFVRPSAGNQILDSIAGPGKLNIAASMKTQAAATEAAKKQLGLPKGAELVDENFRHMKDVAAAPYREVKALPGGATLLEQVQQKRSDAAAFWRLNGTTPSPENRKAAMQAEQEAHQAEVAIDNLAKKSGIPGLLDRVRGARKSLAQIYDVEAATNVGDGHVSLAVLGGMKDAGKPLSGNLDVLAKWWNALKPVSREGSSLGSLSSGTDAASSALLSTTAVSGSGSLLGVLAGAAPGVRSWARNKSLSPEVQKSLTMDPSKMRLDLYPKAARGLSRAALIAGSLATTDKGSEQR